MTSTSPRGRVTLVALALAVTGCGDDDEAGRPPPSSTTSTATTAGGPRPGPVRVRAAGDVSGCDTDGDEDTARLLDDGDATVLVLGDAAYGSGTAEQFARCYDPTWGRYRDRTRPAPGNHEYGTDEAAGYFDYFGARAGPAGRGWYSFEEGAWHVVSLNSNCDEAGGCGRDSPQGRWLRADLAASNARCTLAYWHHPRFSSGTRHGSDDDVDPLWRILDAAGADVVLAGHEHNYERFAPLDADGRRDGGGMRSFVVGTGGRSHYRFGDDPLPGSEVRNDSAFGVLELTLRAARYEWRFLPTAGASFTDRGAARCR